MMRSVMLIGVLLALFGSLAWAQQGILAAATDENGNTSYRMIQVNHLNIRALAEALGGTTINLNFTADPFGSGYQWRESYYRNPYSNGYGRDSYRRDPYYRDRNDYDPYDPYYRNEPNDPYYRQPYPQNDLPPARSSAVDRNAPLAPFISEDVTHILGIEH